MKIAILSRWNTACGVSFHAEIVGREWVKKGHGFTVLAPNNIRPVARDEEYVIRCFSDEGDHTETFFHTEPFLDTDYEILVMERLDWVPLEPLKEIFSKIRKKAKIVYVVQERKLPTNPLFYEFEWDAIVCFDDRYKQQWLRRFDKNKLHMIPYPTGYLRKGDKQKARKELDLPLDKKIVFSYGWAPELHIFPILSAMQRLNKTFPFIYLILAEPKYVVVDIKRLRTYEFIKLRHELPPLERIYTYLHASDIYLMHKQKDEIRKGEAVISSSILMCLGALTPVVTSDTEFSSVFDGEVMKYSNRDELYKLLIRIFEQDKVIAETLTSAEKYVTEHSPKKIAGEFIRLFNQLLWQ